MDTLTHIKIGQFLTTRPDLLAPEFIQELSKLQDVVPSDPWEDVRSVLIEELEGEPEKIFSQIDSVPLAAALYLNAALTPPEVYSNACGGYYGRCSLRPNRHFILCRLHCLDHRPGKTVME